MGWYKDMVIPDFVRQLEDLNRTVNIQPNLVSSFFILFLARIGRRIAPGHGRNRPRREEVSRRTRKNQQYCWKHDWKFKHEKVSELEEGISFEITFSSSDKNQNYTRKPMSEVKNEVSFS